MPNTERPVDKISEICGNLIKAGLDNFPITASGNDLKIDFADEFLRLSPVAQDKAYKVAVKGSNRLVIDFVKQMMKELSNVAELNGDDETSPVPPEPGRAGTRSSPPYSTKQPNLDVEGKSSEASGSMENSSEEANAVRPSPAKDGLSRRSKNHSPVGGTELPESAGKVSRVEKGFPSPHGSQDDVTSGSPGVRNGSNNRGPNSHNSNGKNRNGDSLNDPKVVPRTPAEYYEYLNNFVDKNLGPFGFDEKTKQRLAHRAAEVADELKFEYGLRDDEVPKLAQLSFFDIFILCDNSGSMKLGNRIQALNQTLQSVAHWATRIEKDGISLRFLNGNQERNGLYDGLTDLNKIDDLISKVVIRGNTRLGSMLNDKVVSPLVKKAARRKQTKEQIKPRIVMIITDGEPIGEDKSCLRDMILDAKTGKGLAEYGKMATVFIISRVGASQKAMEFIEGLSADDQISDMMFSSNSRLEQVMEDLVGEGDSAYKRYLMRMFIAAVGEQAL